jgi:hypothetical protein
LLLQDRQLYDARGGQQQRVLSRSKGYRTDSFTMRGAASSSACFHDPKAKPFTIRNVHRQLIF